MSIEKEGTQQKGGKEGGKDQTVILGGLILVYCCVYFFFIYSIQGHDPTITSEDLSAIPAQFCYFFFVGDCGGFSCFFFLLSDCFSKQATIQ